MAPTNGAAEGRSLPPKDFPPLFVGKLLKALFTFLRFTAVAMAVSGASMGVKWLLELHMAGRVVPALVRWADATVTLPTYALACGVVVALAIFLAVALQPRPPVYLVDFECFRPDDSLKVTYDRFINGSRDYFNQESMDFQTRILHKSGLSEETFFPEGLHRTPPQFNMNLAREEAELVMFGAVRNLLAKTRIDPDEVDILVVNCSLFNPTPSLSAMIINHFGMRSDIDSFNLGGMGCSAGIIAIDLGRKMLRERGRDGYALVVSTENITQNWYIGKERSMIIPNTIFRLGAAAVLLTNKLTERYRAKYELEHVVRVHMGADDAAYKCVFQRPDADAQIGVELSKDLVSVASKAMERNMTRLGPLVLPWHEKLMFASNWVARWILRMRVPRYIPDFRESFDHFCLHVGGRGVVEGLSKQLKLSPRQMAPSANTLHWYGNTSSSTVWYSFGFVESVQGVRTGDRVWQIGFGSGFKCNSVVWRALRPIKVMHKAWEHVAGREEQAMDTLRRIAAETAAERQQKQPSDDEANGKPAAAKAAEGDAKVHVTGRALRSGKVVGGTN